MFQLHQSTSKYPRVPQRYFSEQFIFLYYLPVEHEFSAESLLRCVGVDGIPRYIKNITILTNIQSIPGFAKNNNRWHFCHFVFYFSLENYGTESLNFKCIQSPAGFQWRLGEYQWDYHPSHLVSKDCVCIVMKRREDSNGLSDRSYPRGFTGSRKTNKSKHQWLGDLDGLTGRPLWQKTEQIYFLLHHLEVSFSPPGSNIFEEVFFWGPADQILWAKTLFKASKMIRRIGRVSGYAYQHPMCSCMHAGAPNACASSCARAQTGVHAATCHAHQIERLIRPINCRFLHEAVFSKYLVTSSRNVKNHSILNFSSYFRFLYNGPYCFGYPQI